MLEELQHAEHHTDAAHHDGEGHEAHGGHHSTQPLIILFIFVGLFFGGVLREVNKKTKFPYTPMLIIVGIVLGHWRNELGVIGASVELASYINPHMLLFIFIPVLIFESGFNCDWYVFKRALFNIILLAGPGVLWGAILLACCLKWVCGYTAEEDQVTWAGALTMGSILSATDPVAVVALLKELGASVTFGHLIEGESLLNDGVAMVFYQVFVELAKEGKTPPTPVGIATNLIRIAGGGPILGIAMGIIGSIWLRRVIRDDVLTSTITFIACYIVFYCAEFTFIHVSGILAIVVLGLFMSAFGKTKIYPESEHAVHTVWSFAQYGCETLIFLLTGIIIGIKMINTEHIYSSDWIKLLIFYICMIVMRFVMVATFYPLLRSHGYGLTKEEFYVLVWGGLRGALGLTLALMVGVDEELPPRLRSLTVFYMSGTATLTLLINGTTCGSLVNYLGMVKVSKVKGKLVEFSLQKMHDLQLQKGEQLKGNKYLNQTEWKEVNEMVGYDDLVSKIADVKQQNKQSIGQQSGDHEMLNRRDTTYGGLSVDEVNLESRGRCLRLLKSLFWERYEHGQISGEATRMLEEGCDICLEKIENRFQVWEQVYTNISNDQSLKWYFKVQDWPLIGNMAKQQITRSLAFIYEIATTFISTAKEAKKVMQSGPKQNWFHQLFRDVDKEISDCETYIASMSTKYETIIKAIHTKRSAISILNFQKKFLKEYNHKGYIDDSDFQILLKDVDRKIVSIENKTFNWDQSHQTNLYLIQFPIFSTLGSQYLQSIQHSQKQKNFSPSTTIFSEGDTIDHYYIIMKGTVIESFGNENIYKGVGSFISFPNAALQADKSFTGCRAVNDVVAAELSFDKIHELIEKCETFERQIVNGSLYPLIQLNKDQSGNLFNLSEDQVNDLAIESAYLKSSQQVELKYGGYLLKGKVNQGGKQNEQLVISNEQVISQCSYLAPGQIYIPTEGEISYFSFQTNPVTEFEGRQSTNIMLEQQPTSQEYQPPTDNFE